MFPAEKNYSKVIHQRMDRAARLEPIKHIEWALIFYFLFYAFIMRSIFPLEEFILLIIGLQLPDLVEALAYRFLNLGHQERRRLTHTPIIGLELLVPGLIFNYHPLVVLGLGYLIHLLEDIFAGGSPVFLLGPFTDFGQVLLVDRQKRLIFGEKVKNKVGFLWEENTNSDNAWFWIAQFWGTILCAISFCIYVTMIPPP